MEFLSAIISGLSMGGTYAMIALGYTMVYGIAKMLNFAHGDVIMIGAYMVYTFIITAKMPIWLGILLSVLVCVVFGIVIERFAYKPLRGASPLAVLITAIGVSYLLQAVAQIVFGSEQKTILSLMIAGSLDLGGLKIDYSTIVTLIVATVIMVALTLFVKCTKLGRAMLAVSEDRDAARLMGIDVNNVIMVTFIIGSALASVAGVFTLMKAPAIVPTLGAMPGIKAFTAAVIGGIGSIPGAMVGGLLLGVVEAICLKTPLAAYTEAIEFVILIVILLVRPSGLLGKKRREKV